MATMNFAFLLLLCTTVAAMVISSTQAADVPLGVNYGTVADNLPTPAQAAALLKTTIINKVKLFSIDAGILRAMANTGIEVMVGISNDQIKPLAAGVPAAKQWVQANIAPYLPATKIAYLSVGNEVISYSDGQTIWDLQFALENLYQACQELGYSGIKVTTPHSMGLLQSSVPPSNGSFGDGAAAILKPILSFLARTNSPYLTNAYPFFGYLSNPNSTNLQYALFSPQQPHYDPKTKLSYTNMFDAQVDAVYAAIAKLGFNNVSVAVGETGWPSAGDQYEPGVGLENAKKFMSSLVSEIVSGRGTPLKPHQPVLTYLFALFNEDLKPGAASERNYGLFTADMTPVYDCGIMKKGAAAQPNPRAGKPRNQASKNWCVAKPGMAADKLQAALNWACQQSGTDCAAVKSGGACFVPNTLESHASYVMNSYYQYYGKHPWNCDFGGTATLVNKNPSHGSCIYKAT